jgi:hypothetical protein
VVRLRGHHLICLHFFLGEGYKPEFIENLKEVLKRAEAGEEIEIPAGADDICRECPYLKDTICLYDKNAEDEIREMDRTATALLGLENKEKVKWMDIKKKIPGVFKKWAKRYCEECDWRRVCEKNKDFPASFDVHISRVVSDEAAEDKF